MTKSPIINIKNSIATKLLRIVFSFYLLIAVTVTIVHMVAEYYNTKDDIIDDLRVLHKMVEPSMAEPLWNVDYDILQKNIVGMLHLKSIVGVKIIGTETGSQVAASGMVINEQGKHIFLDQTAQPLSSKKENKLSGLFGHSLPITYINGEKVGVMTLYSTKATVFQKVQYGFFFIIVNSVIKTIALWVIFLMVSRHLLSQPLSILTQATKKLDLDTLEHIKPKIKTPGRNELKILEEAFYVMIQKLITARNRSVSLRQLSGKIGKFKNAIQILRYAFRELCEHTNVTNGVFFFEFVEDAFSQYQMYNTSHPFLSRFPDQNWLDELFSSKDQELLVFNSIDQHHSLYQYYKDELSDQLSGGHFIYVKLHLFEDHIICLFRKSDLPPFDSADIEFIKSVIMEIRTTYHNLEAIRHNVRMEGELVTASAVQKALLPKKLPQVHNLELAHFFQSATETGGDWHGFITEIKNSLYILIGDVTGHGTPAALVSATAAATSHTLEELFRSLNQVPSPAQILTHLHQTVYRAGFPDFLMTFFAIRIDLDTGKIVFANAAHNFPILLSADGTVKHLLNTNIQLGYDQEWEFSERSGQLTEGDILFLFTDGVIENMNPEGKMWRERNLIRKLKQYHSLSSQEILLRIVKDIYEFYDNRPLDDDVTMVACKVVQPFVQAL